MSRLLNALVLVFCLAVSVEAGGIMPQVSVGFGTGDGSGSLKGLEPVAKWETSGAYGETDVEGGLTVRVEDTNSFPFTVWGKAGRSVHGWDVSTRLESSSSDLSSVGIDIAASGDSTSVLLKGGADTSAPALAVNSLGLTQRLSGLGGSWTVAPRYNVDARKPDIRVVYGTEDTVVAVDAAPDKQKITISQRLGADNTITPSVSSAGELELEYRHDLGDGSLTASFKPDDSFQLGWSDGEWQANFKAPVQGLYRFNSGVQMNIRRTVDLTGMGAAPGITGGAGDG